MEFPGVWYEERACGNSRGQIKKNWNFHGSSFLDDTYISKGCKFGEIFKGEALFSPEFSRVQWQT